MGGIPTSFENRERGRSNSFATVPYPTAFSSAISIRLIPERPKGRGKGWAMPLASTVRQRNSYLPGAGTCPKCGPVHDGVRNGPGEGLAGLGIHLHHRREFAVGQIACPISPAAGG